MSKALKPLLAIGQIIFFTWFNFEKIKSYDNTEWLLLAIYCTLWIIWAEIPNKK